MCGILGVCVNRADELNVELLDTCRDTLRHRGPDAAGHFLDGGVYLGFRRLSVIDLSSDGDQPMTSADGRYTIVFNGEIYNYLELREDLESRGSVFKSHSDTEVLLHLYARQGIRCLDKLNGMFAFGLYDKVERTLLLVRDRCGVKPLFYWTQGRSVAFASEVRAMRRLPGFPTAIDPLALGLFFRLGSVPDWIAIHPGLSKLAAGCWIRFCLESGKVDGPAAYWDLPPAGEDDGKTEGQWLDDIEALLWDATRIRMRADVPLGMFLSGGIDSALVAAAAAGQRGGLTSLTVGLTGEPEDETAMALQTARHLGLNATTRHADIHEAMDGLPRVMAHFDEPFSDTSAVPTSLICAEARRDFTVALSGDAGDEVFGGYENHVRAWRWRALDRFSPSWRRGVGAGLAALAPPDSMPKRFFTRLEHPVGQFGLGAKRYPFQDWIEDCLKPEFKVSARGIQKLYGQHVPIWAGATSIDLAQRTDLRSYLVDDILVKVDRMSMMHGLEVRSPFLDYRVVELGLKVPSRLRTKHGRNKYLLRRLAARRLPKVVSRAPKRGFGIPLKAWLRSAASARVWKPLVAEAVEGYPDPLAKGGADRLWRLGQTNPALAPAVWGVMCYRWWCQGR